MNEGISFIDGELTENTDGTAVEVTEDAPLASEETEADTVQSADAEPAVENDGDAEPDEENDGGEPDEPTSPEQTDYAQVIAEDVAALKASFPELKDLSDITELDNPIRYAALRDMGLTAAEAYLATTPRRAVYDNRSHLSGAFPRAKSTPPTSGMSRSEWAAARELFSDLSDSEIHELYKKATR